MSLRSSFLLAVVVAILTALMATWPAAIDPHVVIGHWNHPDCLSNHWLLEWVADNVVHGRSLLHNDRYYWPFGDYPLLAGNGAEGFPYLPFHLLLAWPASASAYCIVVLALNGLAAWWAARRFGVSEVGAVFAAGAFGANPYVLQEMGSGRFSQSDVVLFTLALGWFGGLLRDLREGKDVPWWQGLIGGLCWGLAADLYWYHGYFVAIGLLALAIPHLVVCRTVPWKVALAWIGAGAVTVAYPLWWYLSHWSLIPGTNELVEFPHREAWGDSILWVLPVNVTGAHQGQAFAIPVMLLTIAAIVRAVRRRSREDVLTLGLVLVVVLGMGLARGPRLFDESPDLFTLFYGWSRTLQRFWWPSRHLVLVQLAMSVLAGLGADVVAERIVPRWRAVAVLAMCALVPASLWATGDLVDLPLSTFEAPEFYEEIAKLPDGVLAEVPLSPKLASNQQMLSYQLVHHKVLWNGHAMWVQRVRPPEWDALLESNSFLRGFTAWEAQETPTIDFDAADLEALRDRGLRYVSVNHEYVPKGMQPAYDVALGDLFGQPILGDDRAVLYDVRHWTGKTHVQPPGFHLEPGAMFANGVQPLIASKPGSLGLHVYRDTSKAFQGLHPDHVPSGRGPGRPPHLPRP